MKGNDAIIVNIYYIFFYAKHVRISYDISSVSRIDNVWRM